MFGLERRISLRAIGREAVDTKAGRGQRFVGVAEQTCLGCAYGDGERKRDHSLISKRAMRSCNLQPGVDALGYVNKTTPVLLSSTSFASVVFVPSCVSISPPRLARSMLSPTDGAPAAGADFFAPLGPPVTASLTASTLAATAAFALPALEVAGFAPAFFLAGRAGAGGGVLRLRSSTML